MKKACILCIALLIASLCLSACTSATLLDPTCSNNMEYPSSNVESYKTEPISPDTTNNSEEELPVIIKNKLIVNGESLSVASHITFTSDGAMVPFVEVLKELGAEVLWTNDSTAKLVFDGKEYSLDTMAAVLTKEDNQANCLIAAPGSMVHHQTVDGVFLLDHITMRTALMIMGAMVNVTVDYENSTVTITS